MTIRSQLAITNTIGEREQPYPRSPQKSGSSAEHGPKHVLYLLDQLVAVDGGAEGALLKMIERLPPERYRPSVATLRLSNADDVLKHFRCPVHDLAVRRTYDWTAIRGGVRLRRLLRSGDVSIVHTFFESADLWGGLVSKLSRCPILISSRRDMGFKRSSLQSLAYKLMGPVFDQVHAVSDAVREHVTRQDRLNPAKVVTLHNGVDLEKIDSTPSTTDLRTARDLETASHLIVDVGWIRRIKGTDVLIHTAALVCREFPRVVFLVIGGVEDEAYFSQLQRLIESLQLVNNFVFVGSSENVCGLLKECDIFCHLSRSDGLSNAVLEAMACSLPCVITRVGGNHEAVIDGETGYTVPAEQAELAAERLLRLLRNSESARRMGKAGRRIVETKFSANAMVTRLVSLYDDLIEQC